MDALRIAQISDLHLFADKKGELLGVKTEESFHAVISLLKKASPQPDLILLSGDLSQDHSETAYRRLANLLKPFSVPVYCLPGNHDDPKIMAQVYPYPPILAERHISLKNWDIVLLDTHKPKAVEGLLAPSELNYLQTSLQSASKEHIAIVFHHHPFPVGCKWLDTIGLSNAEAFWQLIAPYPKVKLILFGHIHQVTEKKFNGIPCYSLPSTCIQFKTLSDNFALEELPPGYRWVELYPDGNVQTEVRRAAHYIGKFDANAKGY